MSFISPDKILPELRLSEGMRVADFGCGAGFFTVAMAKSVGDSGEVMAVDVQKSSLTAVESRVNGEGLNNVKYIWADLEVPGATKIASDFLDLVLLADTLFQSSRKEDILKESYRVLARESRLVIIDWSPDALGIGPHGGYRVSKDEMRGIAEKIGFKLVQEFTTDDYHYGFIFVK